MARIADVEIERLKVEVSLVGLVEILGRRAGETGRRSRRPLSVP